MTARESLAAPVGQHIPRVQEDAVTRHPVVRKCAEPTCPFLVRDVDRCPSHRTP